MKQGQRCLTDDNTVFFHREPPSRKLANWTIRTVTPGITASLDEWRNSHYYGLVRRFTAGFGIGGGPYAVISISSLDETARHDWRDFQAIKSRLVGEEWEAVELYPSESRHIDPSNRFYLWCVPPGVFDFGLPERRHVLDPSASPAPQRPFPG